MMRNTTHQRHLFAALFVLSTLAGGGVMAQGPRGGGAYGDWRITIDFDGRQMESILALSRDQDGNRTGQWISFWGASDLSDVTFDAGDLSFGWTSPARGGETQTSTFTGRIEDRALTGKLSGDRGEFDVTGERVPWPPRAVGNWELKFRIGDRDITTTLKVTADENQTLAGEWVSEWGEHQITEITADRSALSFKRTTKFEDREFESTFDGTMERDALTGTISSEMGEVAVTGTRLGADLVGTWTLDITSERGPRKQRLRVNRDLSALYGAIEVAAVALDGNQISFPMTLDFGDQPFEMSFKGTMSDGKLTGELITPRGTREVTGSKVVRTPRNRGPR